MYYNEFIRPESLEQAYDLNRKKTNFIMGGNMWLRLQRRNLGAAIDVIGLVPGGVEETPDSFIIGAMCSLHTLEAHEGFNQYTGGMAAKALSPIVGVQFRNTATVGGSIWGRFGFSDLLTLLMPMDCTVELYKGGSVPLSEFSEMKPDGDILIGVTVKKTPVTMKYDSVRITKTDFPVLTCCCVHVGDKYRAAIGARPGRAVVYESEMSLSAGGIAALAAETVPTGSNLRGSSEYRKRLIRVLVKRCMTGI